MPGTRPKLLHIALALMRSSQAVKPRDNKDQPTDYAVGKGLKYYLDNAYRRAGLNKPSRAAHYKRLAKKRKNIRARGKK